MEVRTGTDIIEVERIQKSIEELGDNFLNKIYTKNEINYCQNTKKLMYQHYAARFAVKEAAFKAVSTLLSDKYDLTWKNVETINDENGKPTINFISLPKEIEAAFSKITSIDVSISHIKDFAIANVVILVTE